MSIVDTTDGDSITSNGVLMVKDKRSKTGYKKASDRKVIFYKMFNKLCLQDDIFIIFAISYSTNTLNLLIGSSCKNRPQWKTT